MKKTLLSLALLLTLAQAQSLDEALKKAPEQSGVITARLEREAKSRDLERTFLDPLKTPLTELQARQALALAEARLQRALAQAEESIVAAYTQALEAEAQVAVAQKALEVASLAHRAAEIRAQGGGATPLEVQEALNRRLEAEKNLALAQRGLEAARAQLQNLLGPWQPKPLEALPPIPPEETVGSLLKAHADLLQLRQSLELLRFQRGLLDESFTPRREIEALEDQIKTLEENLGNLERNLRTGLTARFNQLAPLFKGVGTAQEALKNAQERYRAEEARYRAGLISRLALLQAELALKQAELALRQAQGAYLRAYYGLLASR